MSTTNNVWDSTRFGEQLRPESPVHPSMEPRVDSRPAMMRRYFNPDDVLYMGATDCNDGRTMLVFEQNGARRAIAIRGTIQEMTHEQTERELEWSRKRHLHAEACLETIYRPSQGSRNDTCRQVEEQEPQATDVPAPDFSFKPAEQEPLPMAPVEPEPQFDMGRAADRRTYPSRTIIDDVNLDPIPEYLGRVVVEGRD